MNFQYQVALQREDMVLSVSATATMQGDLIGKGLLLLATGERVGSVIGASYTAGAFRVLVKQSARSPYDPSSVYIGAYLYVEEFSRMAGVIFVRRARLFEARSPRWPYT